MLILGLFSLGVFLAIDYGLSASTTALIISFQPLLASVACSDIFKAKVSVAQWIGLSDWFTRSPVNRILGTKNAERCWTFNGRVGAFGNGLW